MTTTLALQRRLKALGHDPGKMDGWWGPSTLRAVNEALDRLSARPVTPFTREAIQRVAPNARDDIVDVLTDSDQEFRDAGITTPLRQAHFLAQISTETGGLRMIEENLNYSASRLRQVWPSRFPTLAAAQPYANNPEKLANKVYGGRLGNTEPGDGWRYRGAGLMQTTGRFNYRKAGHEDDPEALRQPRPALASALKFWTDNGLNALADSDNIVAVRKRINGGTNGLEEARIYLRKAKQALGA